jgi:hypothetical protein
LKAAAAFYLDLVWGLNILAFDVSDYHDSGRWPYRTIVFTGPAAEASFFFDRDEFAPAVSLYEVYNARWTIA